MRHEQPELSRRQVWMRMKSRDSQSGKKADAFLSLSTAPLGTKNQVVRDRAVDLMMTVLMSIKSSEMIRQ